MHRRFPFPRTLRVVLPSAIVLLGAVVGLAPPRLAAACSVCLRQADNRLEFIVTTALLTFLPLIVMGGVVWWLRRRVAALEAEAGELARETPLPRQG